MDKKEMAREYYTDHLLDAFGEYHREYHEQTYLAGLDAGQAQLLGRASNEELVLKFIEWITPHYVPMKKIGLLHIAEKVEEILKESCLRSAKLVAEKDKLLEEQFSLVSQIGMEKNTLKIQLFQAKELIKEMAMVINVFNIKAQTEWLEENIDKIKALLGEE